MLWIIIGLIAIGLSLIIVELIFIPGTTVVGILGVVACAFGIVFAYQNFGSETGFYVLMGTIVLALVALVYSLRSRAWSRFSLKTSIDSRVNENLLASLKPGDEGVTISTLRPVGKALFNDQPFEVKSNGEYVEAGTKVRIREINTNQILVEPITHESITN